MTENSITTQAAEPEGVNLEVSPEELSTNFYWTLGKHEQFSLQSTVRGNPTDDEIIAHFESVKAALVMVVKNLEGHARADKRTPIETSTQPDTARNEATGKGPVVAPKPANAPQVPSNGEKQVLELHIVKVEVDPQAGGKAQLKFYEAGHKYPDIYATKPAANWASLLNWDIENFQGPNTFEIALTVGYSLSQKLNSKGNPYKDIEYIKQG